MTKQRGQISPTERDDMVDDARNLPSKTKLAKNLAKAVVKHAADGLKKVDIDVYVERLAVCNKNECGMRVKNRCTHESCGCFLDKKAWWASEDCPMGLWPGVYTNNPTIEEE